MLYIVCRVINLLKVNIFLGIFPYKLRIIREIFVDDIKIKKKFSNKSNAI